jgi:hypothetical protein
VRQQDNLIYKKLHHLFKFQNFSLSLRPKYSAPKFFLELLNLGSSFHNVPQVSLPSFSYSNYFQVLEDLFQSLQNFLLSLTLTYSSPEFFPRLSGLRSLFHNFLQVSLSTSHYFQNFENLSPDFRIFSSPFRPEINVPYVIVSWSLSLSLSDSNYFQHFKNLLHVCQTSQA